MYLKTRPTLYERIYHVVCQIPKGKVATYGQIAEIAGGCSPRNVGYALSALPDDLDVPWQRVINRQGRISVRSGPVGESMQRELLESEGVVFDEKDQVDLTSFRWSSFSVELISGDSHC